LRIRRGEEAPLDIRLANGDVIRCRCKVLADGGRLLNYGNVSDLVHMADQLAAMAIVDELTGAFNRRHFLWELETEWNRSRNHGRSLALLMLDIDAFKSINDRFGHDAGDQVLAQVAVLCRTLKREADTVARIGGEEFAILLPETDLEEARSVAERLRHALAAQVLVAGAGTIAISVSIGVAVAHEEMRNQSDLMKCADEALYAAKRTGRNRVVAASERDVATVLTSRPANTA
jgi:diguanylate cyclase (GGDEF)-like protein